MSLTDLDRFTAACDYPGVLVEDAVEDHLRGYLAALGVEREVVRLRPDWRIEDYPPLRRTVNAILDDLLKRRPDLRLARDALVARDARDARAARDARLALVARDARDALDALDARDARLARVARVARAARVARDALVARAARAALDARDALDALDARDARLARDALDARLALVARDALDALVARLALDALDARDALVARDARAARDALIGPLQRFAAWCIHGGGWWSWSWDLSWLAPTHLGALQLDRQRVVPWSREIFEAFCAGAWLLYWTDDTLYWVAKPVVHRDPAPGARRLHNAEYAALESDVENLYFWHGVLVPAFVVVRPDWITAKHIVDETNTEVRRIMVERFGADRYIQEIDAQSVHKDDWGELYRAEMADDEPLVMVKVVNATPEPDGSLKDYWLRVPPSMRRARQAVAWTFDLPERDYAPAVQT